MILTPKIHLLDNRLVFGNNIINIILSLTIIFDVIFLICGRVGNIYPVTLIKLLMLFVNLRYPNINIISEGTIIITLYLYLIFENHHLKELDKGKLERD